MSALYADDSKKVELQNTLIKIQSHISDAKDRLDSAKIRYDDTLTSKDDTKISNAKMALDNAKGTYDTLFQEHARINNILNSMESSNLGNINKSDVVSTVNKVSKEKELLQGWNVLSIPINFTMLSSNKYLGSHSVIWGFNGTTQRWLKNPEILYPGEGYYIKIVSGKSTVKFTGGMFTTDLGSVIVKDRSWYFLGASEPVLNIDYKQYMILKYVDGSFVKNPAKLSTGDTFWGYRD
jgi:hypothetical protein